MFVPIHIEMQAGDQAQVLSDRFIEYEHAVGDMTEPLTQVATSLGTKIAGQFATEGAGGYTGAWAPLSPVYGAWKEHHSPGTPILVGIRPDNKGTRKHPNRKETYSPSGRMKFELLDPYAMHVTPMRLLYAPTSDIAGFHQTGTSRMPARPIVSIYPETLRTWDRFFVAWLDREGKKFG